MPPVSPAGACGAGTAPGGHGSPPPRCPQTTRLPGRPFTPLQPQAALACPGSGSQPWPCSGWRPPGTPVRPLPQRRAAPPACRLVSGGLGDPCVGPRPPSLAAWPSAAGCAQATGHRGRRQHLLVGQRGSGRVNEGRRVGGEQASRTLRGRGIASDTGGERGAEAVGGTGTWGTGWLDPAFREWRDGALWDSGDRGPATRPATSGTPRALPASGDG